MTDFDTKTRKSLAKSGKALPDGSYPTPTLKDLDDAIQAWGRGSGDKATLKSYLMRRAVALNASNTVKTRIRMLKG